MAHIHYMKLSDNKVIISAKVGRGTKHGSAIVGKHPVEGSNSLTKEELLEMYLELKDKANKG